jgi:hypothetical protein
MVRQTFHRIQKTYAFAWVFLFETPFTFSKKSPQVFNHKCLKKKHAIFC